jgi:hypothetical protein
MLKLRPLCADVSWYQVAAREVTVGLAARPTKVGTSTRQRFDSGVRVDGASVEGRPEHKGEHHDEDQDDGGGERRAVRSSG